MVLDSLFSKPELSAVLAQAEASSPWEVAKINAGTHDYTDTSYRNSQRIIYDSFELSEEIFKKIRPHLADIEEIQQPTENGQRTFYTLQFYLPSNSSGSPESFVSAKGGTTRFLAPFAGTAYADIEATPGRVLVFQHAELLHTGEEVTDRVKCTVRSDILYEKVGSPVPI
ncbi:hypothetical protein C8J57DRAFT_1224473 [Mycena rebaudengoi]|nr:hypothetical protein C8J57DRAFT_1224473 [Mycena rebaudengoi]